MMKSCRWICVISLSLALLCCCCGASSVATSTDDDVSHAAGNGGGRAKNVHYDATRTDEMIGAIVDLVLLMLVSLSSSALILGILCRPSTRSSTFNLYLVAIVFPDFCIAFVSAMIRIYELTNRGYTIANECTVMSGVIGFGAAANLWLNAVAAMEVVLLLWRSKRCQRTAPPTLRRVLWQVGSVYALGCAAGTLGSSFIFCEEEVENDEQEQQTLDAFKGLFYLVVIVLPIVFVTAACLVVVFDKLLAQSQRRVKTIAIYFGRIVLVFFCFWIPSVVLHTLFLEGGEEDSWLYFLGGYFGAFQALSTFLSALTKADVRESFLDLMCCCRGSSKETTKNESSYTKELSRISNDGDELPS